MKSKKNNKAKLTALITGASSGLGEAIAKNCAGRGFDLVLVSENKRDLDRVRGDIKKKYSCAVTAVVIDLFRPNSADLLFGLCRKRKVRVDLLVNCAGIYPTIDREMRENGCIENIINLHVMAVTKLCFQFGRLMARRKRGYILNISSITAYFPDPASITYGTTKRYVLTLSRALHCEWRAQNVHVTCLTPGGIKTNFFKANRVFIPPSIKSTLITAERCAEIGLNAVFRGTATVTPGISGKLQAFFLRIISRPLTYGLIKRTYFSMKSKSR